MSTKSAMEKHPTVVVERDWKEYLGECLLIVFSVALALGLTEYFTSLHERNKKHEILHQLKLELMSNRDDAQEQYIYYQKVFRLIDSAQATPSFAKMILDSGKFHYEYIFPEGATLHDLKSAAWQQAKDNDAFAGMDFETYALLSSLYSSQDRILNVEPTLGSILFSYDSRKPENLRTTLILAHDALFAWAVQRTPQLVAKYQKAIDALKDY